MGRIIIFFLVTGILFILAFSCCDKDDFFDQYWGEASAIKNGSQWEGLPKCVTNLPHNQGVDIIMDVYNSKRFLREGIVIYKVPFEEGSYKITNTTIDDQDQRIGANYFTSVDDGDVLGDIFYISEKDTSSLITISRKNGKEIWGTFDATFIRDTTRRKSDESIPDTIQFTNGAVHAKLRD